MNNITGLHHITALASSAQKNIDFYAGVLGLRMIKKTVNFDAPDVYHLYYSDYPGTPGTIMTFFPYTNLPKGRKGNGQLTVTSFSVPENSLDFWMQRFDKYHIQYQNPQQRYDDEMFIYFEDNDGLGLEMVANKTDQRKGYIGLIPEEFAVKGFYGILLSEEMHEKTTGLLTGQMDYKLIREQGNRLRFSPESNESNFVDILLSPDSYRARSGSGTIHHVAFATDNDQSQLEVREKLVKNEISVTPVIDRQYFHSIYFREPGGVLFEVATSDMGFTFDESLENLGKSLTLPVWQEVNREKIQRNLVPVEFNSDKYKI